MTIELSIVVPVYGSEGSVRALAERIIATLSPQMQSFEIIFVNDDSPDAVWPVLCALRDEHPEHIVAIRLMRNFGQHNATMCGFRHARGKVIMTMDDDLQHAPEDIPTLLQALKDHRHDVVYGAYVQKKHSSFRNIGSWLVNQIFKRVFHLSFNFSSFRAIRREVVAAVTTYNLNFTFIDGLLAWTTTRIGSTPVGHHERTAGKSGYSLSRLIGLSLNLFTNFSLAPLQVATLAGMSAAFLGFLVGGYFIVKYAIGDIVVPGFASLITAVLVLGGLQLVALGTIGEYVGRLHLNFNRKPQFVIRDRLGGDQGLDVDGAKS